MNFKIFMEFLLPFSRLLFVYVQHGIASETCLSTESEYRLSDRDNLSIHPQHRANICKGHIRGWKGKIEKFLGGKISCHNWELNPYLLLVKQMH